MKRMDSIISLLNSLSKAEKKHFTLQLLKGGDEKDYLFIYDLIVNKKIYDVDEIKRLFLKSKPNGSFEIAGSHQVVWLKQLVILLDFKVRPAIGRSCDIQFADH